MDLKIKRAVQRRSSKETESGKNSDADYVPPYQVECNFRKSFQEKKPTNPEILVKIPKRKLGELNKLWDPNYDVRRDRDANKSKNLESVIDAIRSKYFGGKTKLYPLLVSHLIKSGKNGERKDEQQPEEKNQVESVDNDEENNCPDMTFNNNIEQAVRRAHFKKEFIRQHSRPNEIDIPPDDFANGDESECQENPPEAVQATDCSDEVASGAGAENFQINSSDPSTSVEDALLAMHGENNEIFPMEVTNSDSSMQHRREENQQQCPVGKHNLPTTIIPQPHSRVALPLKAPIRRQKHPDENSQFGKLQSSNKASDTPEAFEDNHGFHYPEIVNTNYAASIRADTSHSAKHDTNASSSAQLLSQENNLFGNKQVHHAERKQYGSVVDKTLDMPILQKELPLQATRAPAKISERRRFSQANNGWHQPKPISDNRSRKLLDSGHPSNMLPPSYNEHINRNYHQLAATNPVQNQQLNNTPSSPEKAYQIPIIGAPVRNSVNGNNAEYAVVELGNMRQQIPQNHATINQYNPYQNMPNQIRHPYYAYSPAAPIPRRNEQFINQNTLINPTTMIPQARNVYPPYLFHRPPGETSFLNVPVFDRSQFPPLPYFRQNNVPTTLATYNTPEVHYNRQLVDPRLQLHCNPMVTDHHNIHVQTSPKINDKNTQYEQVAAVNPSQMNAETNTNLTNPIEHVGSTSVQIRNTDASVSTTKNRGVNFKDASVLLDVLLNRIKWNFDNILDTVNTTNHNSLSISEYWKGEGYVKFRLYLTDLIEVIDEIKGLNSAVFTQRHNENSKVLNTDELTHELEGFIRHSSVILATEMQEKLKDEYIKYCKNFFDNQLNGLYSEHKKKYRTICEKLLAEKNMKNEQAKSTGNDVCKSASDAVDTISKKRTVSAEDDDSDECINKKKKMVECSTQTIHNVILGQKSEIVTNECETETKVEGLSSNDGISNALERNSNEIKLINTKDTPPSTQNNYITIMQCPNGPSIRIGHDKCTCILRRSVHAICESKNEKASTVNLIQLEDTASIGEEKVTETLDKLKNEVSVSTSNCITTENTENVMTTEVAVNTVTVETAEPPTVSSSATDTPLFVSRAIKAEYLSDILTEYEKLLPQHNKSNTASLENMTANKDGESDAIIDCETYVPKLKQRKLSLEKKALNQGSSKFMDDGEVIVIDSDHDSDGNENVDDDKINIHKDTKTKEKADLIPKRDNIKATDNVGQKTKITAIENHGGFYETNGDGIPTMAQVRAQLQECFKAGLKIATSATSSKITDDPKKASITNSVDQNTDEKNITAEPDLIRTDNVKPIAELKISVTPPGNIVSVDKSSVVKYVARRTRLVEAKSLQGTDSKLPDSQNKLLEKQTSLLTATSVINNKGIVNNGSPVRSQFSPRKNLGRTQILENILKEQAQTETTTDEVKAQHYSNVHIPRPGEKDNTVAQKAHVRNSIINLINKNKTAHNTSNYSINGDDGCKSSNPPQFVGQEHTTLNNDRRDDGTQQQNVDIAEKHGIYNGASDDNTRTFEHNYNTKNSSSDNSRNLGEKDLRKTNVYHNRSDSFSPKERSVTVDDVRNVSEKTDVDSNRNSNPSASQVLDQGGIGIVHQIQGLKVRDHLTPEEYVEEVKAMDKIDIPMVFKCFYNYVTKQQILQQVNPISFKLFLELLNNGGLQDFYKKYVDYQRKREADLAKVPQVVEAVPKYPAKQFHKST